MRDTGSAAVITGDFTVFGYVKNFDGALHQRFAEKLGIQPKTVSLGNAGCLFFYTSYGDVAETGDAIALKLGFVRAADQSPLTANQILTNKLVGPGFARSGDMRGNGLVICLSKIDPQFTAYKTTLSVPQLYFNVSNEAILCSDRLSCLVKLIDHIALNEDIVPLHFLFRSTPGDLTYFRGVKRLPPGQFMRWADGKVREQSTQRFSEIYDLNASKNNDPTSLISIDRALNSVIGDYYNQAQEAGHEIATLLSGGVDSTLIQYYINQYQQSDSHPSYSYALRSTDFQREVQYAQAASDLLGTDHTFVKFTRQDFPGLLTRAVDILAQPPILETEPSMLAIAEFAGENHVPSRYFASGQGADTVFGLAYSVKLKGIHMLQQIPYSASLFKAGGKILAPAHAVSTMLTKGANILSTVEDVDSFFAPANTIAVYANIEALRKCFGDDTMRKAFRYRREFAANYQDTGHYLEKVHFIDLLTDTYELGVQRQQIFLAHGKEQLHPFFDDDILRAAFAFPPDIRYIQGLRPKYLLKDLLTQKTNAPISKRPKGFSIFERDLLSWMKSGPLRPFIDNIELPGFLSRKEFEQKRNNPDYFLWILLIFDIFRSRCLV